MSRSWLAWVSLAAAGLDDGDGRGVRGLGAGIRLVRARTRGLLGAFRRRHFWPMALVIGALVAATGLFWMWSLISAGM